MTRLQQLAELGQTIWLDHIRRALFTSGDLQALIDEGLCGLTSNTSVMEKVVAGSTDYDKDIHRLVKGGKTGEEIYEALVLEDIRRAADLLRPVYQRSGGADGYVSLEVSPLLAHNTKGTVAEARRLFAALDRPNVMIKVPATEAGIRATELLIARGINVNVTLIFSLAHYEAAAEAYLAGLERLIARGGDPTRVASVASLFVSRVDSAVDPALEERGERDLLGKTAIANAKVVYARFRELFSGERWERLAAHGGRVQRLLWASTSTKNPLCPDTLYVDSLIAPDTVNTVPPATLQAFRDHGSVALTLEAGLAEARGQLARLAELGIDLPTITESLQEDGVAALAHSFEALMASIAEKRERLFSGRAYRWAHLGSCEAGVEDTLRQMDRERIIPRIWAHDHTVWRPEPRGITDRLGWLHIAEAMREDVDRLEHLARSAREDGYTDALLLGMGGSSLAAEVLRKTFGVKEGYLNLAVLDSTDPGAVLAHAERLDPARTLFVVSTKSGGTVETLSFFKFFYNWAAQGLDAGQAGAHFVAITDPGSRLADLAAKHHFRATFLNDPNIGGRNSALSYFGLVPAALVGVDILCLLERASRVSCGTEPCVPVADNPAAWLGAILGELAQAGRDKATFLLSPAIASLGDWVEQLIAESTGKEGQGILPVVGEPVGPPRVYGEDRLFVHLQLQGDNTHDAAIEVLAAAGHPVVYLCLQDLYDLGGQFFLWELATAVAGSLLGIQPFNQPNVEAAKELARRMVAAYTETGKLPSGESSPLKATVLEQFLAQAQPGDYVALQAYVQPTPVADAALRALRIKIRDRYKLATTVGYGPRFLHSTGQLHKGDSGNGLFVQFTTDPPRDAPIPDEAGKPGSSITFGVLKMAQALGDGQALREAGRRVIRFHLDGDVVAGLQRLM